ncbi:glycoside hydrolase family 16 protein [Mycena vulgaris]|nr:glycoside hydrolase family 16 protein [Mycena vulgaris]
MFRLVFSALALLSVSSPVFTQATFGPRAQSRSFRSRRASTTACMTSKDWTLTDHYQGKDFLEHWDFFDRADPTHGLVNYQNMEDATAKGLAIVQNTTFIVAVDNTTELQSGEKRDSVRISSKKVYNAGSLFIADFAAMPASNGAWPAWWSVGPSWPNGGEIDVLEGVHKVGTNKMTLHTSAGCVVDRTEQITGKIDGTDCKSANGDNQGCGVLDNSTASYGEGFNAAGGGVYAHTWTNDAIRIWHFARKDVPADIIAQAPDPTTWPVPTGAFSAGPGCDFAQHFQNHSLTVDTTICGDWANDAGSLANAHVKSTCADLVADPKNFDLARWNINYISVYN